MREIKFRGKGINNGEWIEGDLCRGASVPFITYDNDFTVTSSCGEKELSSGRFFAVDPETVGEFTGLKDKNGKEIYEGDIIFDRVDECLGEIKYSEKDGMFVLYTSDKELYDFADIDSKDFEVIGNTHDNPELLEGNQCS